MASSHNAEATELSYERQCNSQDDVFNKTSPKSLNQPLQPSQGTCNRKRRVLKERDFGVHAFVGTELSGTSIYMICIYDRCIYDIYKI